MITYDVKKKKTDERCSATRVYCNKVDLNTFYSFSQNEINRMKVVSCRVI